MSTQNAEPTEEHSSLDECLQAGHFDEVVVSEQTMVNHVAITSCPDCGREFEWIYRRVGIFDERSDQYVDHDGSLDQDQRLREDEGYYGPAGETYSIPIEGEPRELVFVFEGGYSFDDETSVEVEPDLTGGDSETDDRGSGTG